MSPRPEAAAQASPAASLVASSSPASSLLPSPLTDARLLYIKGDFEAALEKYQQVLAERPKSPDAYAGLIRTYLQLKNIQRASETATKALDVADSVPVHVAVGELYFRQGKIYEAEGEWIKVINSGRRDARAYLGLSRVRSAISMHKSAWDLLQKAHNVDPDDPEIRYLWLFKLTRTEQIKFLEPYLAGPNNETPECRKYLQDYLAYLKAAVQNPAKDCRLAGKAAGADTNLVRLMEGPRLLRGYGLAVEVNGHRSKLMLDTGSNGILINRNLAEKAGVTRLWHVDIGGIGDKGNKSGYRAFAETIRVGGMEFHNCTLEVLDKRSVLGDDGLIGTDVFSDFLVDLDFPNEKLRLKELPRRADAHAETVSLRTVEDPGDEGESEPRDPEDRYIAPEMKDYTRVFRFGHMLLIPTSIGKVHSKLFLLDTGSFENDITPAAAREITKIRNSDEVVRGLSGSVNKVFSADKAVLEFGHLKNENQDLTAYDMTPMSDDVGMEISGTLGFELLSLLHIKIDYRDGLVDFEYDPKRWRQ